MIWVSQYDQGHKEPAVHGENHVPSRTTQGVDVRGTLQCLTLLDHHRPLVLKTTGRFGKDADADVCWKKSYEIHWNPFFHFLRMNVFISISSIAMTYSYVVNQGGFVAGCPGCPGCPVFLHRLRLMISRWSLISKMRTIWRPRPEWMCDTARMSWQKCPETFRWYIYI